jgi:diadenosine tetraphosphate (Ap4A) HIT family hydrolase
MVSMMDYTPYRPGTVLLTAQQHVDQIRQRDLVLKQEISWLAQFAEMDYEQARRYVLASRGLLKQP